MVLWPHVSHIDDFGLCRSDQQTLSSQYQTPNINMRNLFAFFFLILYMWLHVLFYFFFWFIVYSQVWYIYLDDDHVCSNC